VLENWIYESNLRPFLSIVFDFVEYEFDESDLQAVEHGLQGTDVEQNIWFDYDLNTKKGLLIALAHDDNSSVIFVKTKSTSEIEAKIAVVLDIMGNYHLS
jgi:hypothetical protein